MGCEVVSVYNDEVIGKIGMPQTIIQDLFDRDYRQCRPISKPKELSPKIQHIFGFTQSFAISKLYFIMIKNEEHLVHVAGRFIVIEKIKNKQQSVITNPEYISAFTVVDKRCLVGLIGGTLLLWDLQFLEVKIEILLPEVSTNISTVGLTSKYIFATDGSTPNNLAYCYDLRTAKLLSAKTISSLQPAIKSINPTQDLHVTASADGIWFIKMHKSTQDIEVIKGMFGTYPKTSMICLEKAGGYIISGGVDGYIYVWKITTYKCCKALKVGDSEIVSIAVKDKHIIFGCLNGRVKVYTFEVRKKEKKESIIDEQFKDYDNDQEVIFIVVDSFLKEGSTIAISASVQDPYLYYCLTKEGVLYQKNLPIPTSQRKKVNLKSDLCQNILKINTTGAMILSGSKVISTYLTNKNILMVDIYSISDGTLILEEERSAVSKEDCQNSMTFSLASNQIAFLTSTNKILVSCTFNIAGQAVSHQNKSDIGSKTETVLDLEHEKFVSFNYTQGKQSQQYLCVTSNESIWIYYRQAKLLYTQKCHLKYQNTIPSYLTVDEQQFSYSKPSQKWWQVSKQPKCLTEQALEEKSKIHAGKVKSIESEWQAQKISCGGGFVIFWK